MSEQKLYGQPCADGDRHLACGDPTRATACYTAAFLRDAESTVQHVHSLGESGLASVVAVLEGWCAGHTWVPLQAGIEPAGEAPVNTELVTDFLLLLNPSNLMASMFRMETLLRNGRHDEAVSRCNALLNAHPNHSLGLLLTRALAWVLSDEHSGNGVVDYLQAFAKRREETVAFVTTEQKADVPRIVHAFKHYLSQREKAAQKDRLLGDCRRFLAAVTAAGSAARPRDGDVPRAGATRRMEEIAGSGAPPVSGLDGSSPRYRTSGLISRAAAHFVMGSGLRRVIRDLSSAFENDPVLARKHFERLFNPAASASLLEQCKSIINAQLADYRETVRRRPDLRSDAGADLLVPVLEALQLQINVDAQADRDTRIRLADCRLLTGDVRGSLELCRSLASSGGAAYSNSIMALRAICHLHAGDHGQALADFQAIVEQELPHPDSCVRAMCGRGLLRLLDGKPYLAALDYITASRLRLDETAFFVKAYVPWNQRGLLYKVLQEEGEKMVRKKLCRPLSGAGPRRKIAESGEQGSSNKEKDVLAVHYLALLLLELDPTDEVSQILYADALYQLGRTEEAHKTLLVSLGKNSWCTSVLARLTLFQLKKGFVYESNQLIKKIIEIGDTSCLLPIMDIFKAEDRDLLQQHCYSIAMSILQSKEGDTYVKEAVAYLSLAIIISGGVDEASLLTRARCYAHLNQKKTAIFDFATILKANPAHVRARCGRAFIYVVLNKQKEAVEDIAAALQTDQELALQEILSLKHEAQNLICSWLYDHCVNALTGIVDTKGKIFTEEHVILPTIGQSLLLINGKNSTWHILYIDILIAKGMYEDASKHMQENFGQPPNDIAAMSRYALIQMKMKNAQHAVENLSILAEKHNKDLEFLLKFLDNKQLQTVVQIASQEASALAKGNQEEKALKYYTLAVLASKNKAKYIRLRAICLTKLKQYVRALEDLQEVIKRSINKNSADLVEDYCFMGHIQLLALRDDEACKNYIKALQLDKSLALTSISSRPGQASLSQHFQRSALRYFEQQLYEEAWNLAEYGLILDESNTKLKKLRTRIKREASGCIVH
ncbi:tetratricopeptide repeat protein 34 isoform X1 [Hypanus sabinus]|uniref:tetratricopeptide repeat protein 34 isoform X1 n=1 Tax=Hypanus sabinus TaxID=79690 RepID=UPI0028C4680D|nr:tetratricopeptide repeat protein 34 isoform X1 [Hypanus sabinus]